MGPTPSPHHDKLNAPPTNNTPTHSGQSSRVILAAKKSNQKSDQLLTPKTIRCRQILFINDNLAQSFTPS